MENTTDIGWSETLRYYQDTRPLTRWWWFAEPISKDDIDMQLDWVEANGFGGVEIAWVYAGKKSPTTGNPIPVFLGERWRALVEYAADAARRRGLACDFTFGTLWPFGGSMVDEDTASQTYTGPSHQRLDRSWETAHGKPPGRLVNHLDHHALEHYAAVMGDALAPAISAAGSSALFADSWEVDPDGLWTAGFGDAFHARFGYDITRFMADLDQHPRERYDYRTLIAEYALKEFYLPYTRICHELGSASRVQAHGAPTDLIAAYGSCDVPESEALLFDPPFSLFASSAAAQRGAPIVSAEAFTCLYGWVPYPTLGPHHKHEQIGDIKLLADALFAHGVNQIFWHGMPFFGADHQNDFYATVHVGPDSQFADTLPALNEYMRQVSEIMRRGTPVSKIASYVPWEEMLMRGELPEELQRPSAKYHWEMHYVRPSDELIGYRPVWVSEYSLHDARYENGVIRWGALTTEALHVDTSWIEPNALRHIVQLAEAGAPVVLAKFPDQPGTRRDPEFDTLLANLLNQPAVVRSLSKLTKVSPLVTGEKVPPFWARQDGATLYIFFANPTTTELTYPMAYGQSAEAYARQELPVVVNTDAGQHAVTLRFHHGCSIILKISGEEVHEITPDFSIIESGN